MPISIPSLIVHIGGAKAGSSAIQNCLLLNRSALAEHGIVVPNSDLRFEEGPADQIWYFEKINELENPERILADDLDALCATYGQKMQRKPFVIVLSAENICNLDPARLFMGLKQKFKIHVVLYIRRQEDAYQAAWQQWFVKTGVDISEWLRTTDGYFCDWDLIVSRWEALSPDKMSIRIFDRDQLVGEDVTADFLALLFPDLSLLSPKKDLNVSFGVHISHLFASLQGMFSSIHDLTLVNLLNHYEIISAEKHSNEWIFDRRQLDIIRDRHLAGNARLKEAYFRNLEGTELFAPVSADAVTGISQEEINRRNIVVLAELLLKHLLEKRA
jgi:hypothetical protein